MKYLFLIVSLGLFFAFTIVEKPKPDFSIVGTWSGEVKEIRGSKYDSVKDVRNDTTFLNIQFYATFKQDQTYSLRAKSMAERILLKQYLKKVSPTKYNIYPTTDQSKYQIRFLSKDTEEKKSKTYKGLVKVINPDLIDITVTLDDPSKKEKIRLKRIKKP